MAGSLDDLRARSDALASSLGDDEALDVNAAILAAEPGDAVATNRLGAGLIAVGRATEAVEVFEAGLEANPANRIMLDRLKQARHAAARPAPKPVSKGGSRGGRSSARGSATWIKAVHYSDDGWTVPPGELRWISDPGQVDESGERVHRADGQPAGAPTWRVGDRVGLYFGGTYKVPVLVEVAELPRFDPAFVERETGSHEDAERWPWVTPIRGLKAVSVEDAPSLSDLGIEHSSMQHRARLKLDAERAGRLLRLLDG
jgi:hypothetical protein